MASVSVSVSHSPSPRASPAASACFVCSASSGDVRKLKPPVIYGSNDLLTYEYDVLVSYR